MTRYRDARDGMLQDPVHVFVKLIMLYTQFMEQQSALELHSKPLA